MCERYDRYLQRLIGKGGEYLPRLWTDKPVALGERTQQIKRGGERKQSLQSVRNRSNSKTNRRRGGGKGIKQGVSGVGNRAPVTSLDRYTVKTEESSGKQKGSRERSKQETEHLSRLWTDTL